MPQQKGLNDPKLYTWYNVTAVMLKPKGGDARIVPPELEKTSVENTYPLRRGAALINEKINAG